MIMEAAELFETFVAHGVTTAEIAAMDVDVMTLHVGQMRQDEPDDLPLTNEEIARLILAYAWVDVSLLEMLHRTAEHVNSLEQRIRKLENRPTRNTEYWQGDFVDTINEALQDTE